MKRLADFRKQVIEGWTVQRIAAVLIVVGLVVFIFGAVTQYCACVGWPNLGDVLNHMIGDFYANVSVDCLSIAFAILVIDRLNERRAEEQEKSKEQQLKAEAEAQLKAQLIREMGSRDNGIALHAVEELRSKTWIRDGSLRNIRLDNANLEHADLYCADMQMASLYNTNLQHAEMDNVNLEQSQLYETDLRWAELRGANLRKANLINVKLQGAVMIESDLWKSNPSDWQLVTVSQLLGAMMPNGRLYDGRYNLIADVSNTFHKRYRSPEDMADFYGVPIEDYLAGQEWARENLARVRLEAGLDPDTGLTLELTNGTEPQPADAPAPPAPRRNGPKASMIIHRVRR